MKLALRIISYILGGLLVIGLVPMIYNGYFEIGILLPSLLVIVQSTLAIIYTYKK